MGGEKFSYKHSAKHVKSFNFFFLGFPVFDQNHADVL